MDASHSTKDEKKTKKKKESVGTVSVPRTFNNAESITLFSYWRSSSSWRVRLVLHYKDIPYTYHAVNLLKKDQHTPEYRAVNPHGLIPALRVDGSLLAESAAIMEYLEETRPEPRILPVDPKGRAMVRRLSQMVIADIQPLQNMKVLAHVGEEGKMAWAQKWITEGLRDLEKVVSQCAGTFAYGDTPTMADFCIVPQIYNANRFNVKMSEFPVLSRIAANLEKLAFAQRAHPDSQPDAVK